MATAVISETLNTTAPKYSGWEGFNPGLWQREINVRNFIQQNYKPYEGDHAFLAPATERTKKIWKILTDFLWRSARRGYSISLRFPAPSRRMLQGTSIEIMK